MSLWVMFYKTCLSGSRSINDPDTRWRRTPRGIKRFTVLELPDRRDWSYDRLWLCLPLVYPSVSGLSAIARGRGLSGRERVISLSTDYDAGSVTRPFRQPIATYYRPNGERCSDSDATCLRRAGQLLPDYRRTVIPKVSVDRFLRDRNVLWLPLAQCAPMISIAAAQGLLG